MLDGDNIFSSSENHNHMQASKAFAYFACNYFVMTLNDILAIYFNLPLNLRRERYNFFNNVIIIFALISI